MFLQVTFARNNPALPLCFSGDHKFMKTIFAKLTILALLTMLSLPSFASADTMKSKTEGAGKEQTLTGQVGDAMCGRQHMMAGKSETECTRACIKEGSKYALIVGDKVIILEGKVDGLDAVAGKNATVTGTMKGDTMTVTSVVAAK